MPDGSITYGEDVLGWYPPAGYGPYLGTVIAWLTVAPTALGTASLSWGAAAGADD